MSTENNSQGTVILQYSLQPHHNKDDSSSDMHSLSSDHEDAGNLSLQEYPKISEFKSMDYRDNSTENNSQGTVNLKKSLQPYPIEDNPSSNL